MLSEVDTFEGAIDDGKSHNNQVQVVMGGGGEINNLTTCRFFFRLPPNCSQPKPASTSPNLSLGGIYQQSRDRRLPIPWPIS